MREFLLLAGAAALLSAAPAIAKPGGGHGKAHANTHAMAPHAVKSQKAAHVTKVKAAKVTKISARDQSLAHKYGGALCPPGLYKKTPSCMPPGQNKRLFREGQRINPNYKYYTPYGSIPQALVNQYNLSDQNRYIYRNNVIYTVDPTTNLVTSIINAVL